MVETKSYAGWVSGDGGDLWVGRRRRTAAIDEAKREADVVARVVAPQPVTPVIVIHRARFPIFRITVGGVRVLKPGDLVDHLRAMPVTLAPADVIDLAARIDRTLPRASKR